MLKVAEKESVGNNSALDLINKFSEAGFNSSVVRGEPRMVLKSHYTMIIPIRPDENGRRALAFNALNKNLLLLDEAEVEAFERMPADEAVDAEGVYSDLTSARLLRDVDYDEFADVKRQYWAKRNDRNNLSITITPTIGCNFACHYCFQGMSKPTSKMAEHVQDQIVEVVKTYIGKIKVLSVCWFGGEPLMDRPAVYRLSAKLIEICDANGIQYEASIISNGYFLDVETANKLLQLRCYLAQLTVDGTKELHDVNRPLTSGRGTYDRLMENISNVAKNTEFKITIRCNVNSGNAASFSDMLDEFAKMGLGGRPNFSVYFAAVESTTKDCASAEAVMLSKADFADTDLMLVRKAHSLKLASAPSIPEFMGICSAVSKSGLVISPEGDVHRCWEMVHDTNEKVGTIFDMAAIEDNPINKRWHAFDPWDNPICSACKISPMCAGMCSHKFVGTEHTSGETSALPCPSWKFNTAEYLFLKAMEMGVVVEDDWDPEQRSTKKFHAGRIHTLETVNAAHALIFEKAENAKTIHEANEGMAFVS